MKTTFYFKRFAATLLMCFCGVFTFTSCQDDAIEPENNNSDVTRSGDQKLLETYALTYKNFIGESDVQILNADTTEISVSKALAEKLGINSFKNHPMSIWDKQSHVPYARLALGEKLVGDRYILTVREATLAEILGDKKLNVNTSIYYNKDAQGGQTRAGVEMPDYAAKFMDENDVIHPAQVMMTDPYGYDEAYHDADAPVASTRSNGEYQYLTAEDLAAEGTRASVRHRILSLHNKVKVDKDLWVGKNKMNIMLEAPTDFDLNYFFTLDGGVKWKFIVPCPYVKKFETGLDGNFSFTPEVRFGFKDKLEIPKDKLKWTLLEFNGYTFVFWVGPIPVSISCKPNMYFKIDGKIATAVNVGFKYEYANEFRGGISYQDGNWSLIRSFDEKKNKFTPIWPQGNVTVTAGWGLFFGFDVKVYGVAGPKVAAGVHMGAKLSGTYEPLHGGTFKASVDCTARIEAGAKIKVLGYEVAEYTQTFDILDPWNIYRYPSDGTEHKDPDSKREENLKKLMNKLNSDEAMINQVKVRDLMSEISDWTRQMKEISGDEADRMVKETVTKMVGNADMNDAAQLTKAANTVSQELYKLHTNMEPQYHKWADEKSWREVRQTLLDSNKELINQMAIDPHFNYGQAVEKAHEAFVQKFKKQPAKTESDLSWLMNNIASYQENTFWTAWEQVKNIPEVKECESKDPIKLSKVVRDAYLTCKQKFTNTRTPDAAYVSFLKDTVKEYLKRPY